MKIETYQRKTFEVDAVRVTDENIEEVATWCGGELRTQNSTGVISKTGPERRYIHVRTNHPLNVRQTQAFVGDWVLYAGTGYKVYTNGAFERSFEQPEVEYNTPEKPERFIDEHGNLHIHNGFGLCVQEHVGHE